MHRRMLLAATGANIPVNLELEGSLSAITTNAQLATFLGISVDKIRFFTNSGTLIQTSIRGNYQIPANQFNGNTTLTKIRDYGVIGSIALNGLRSASNLESVSLPFLKEINSYAVSMNAKITSLYLPSLTSVVGSQSVRDLTALVTADFPNLEVIPSGLNASMFANWTSATLIDMRKLKVYGDPSVGAGSGNISGFLNLKTGCEIRVHIALATANAGNANASLLYAKNNRGAIVKFYDDNGNYVSTL